MLLADFFSILLETDLRGSVKIYSRAPFTLTKGDAYDEDS